MSGISHSLNLELNDIQQDRFHEAVSSQKSPEILLFRILGPQLQKIFSEIISLHETPRVLLHGNPHLENYSRTHCGAGLIDFDRSRVGPTLWDIARGLASITFWSKKDRLRANSEVTRLFFQGYLFGVSDPLAYWEIPDFLRQVRPKSFQQTPQRYLESGKKWSKKVQRDSVELTDLFYLDLYRSYCETLPPNSLRHWELSQVAEVKGSMGKKHYVYVLETSVKTREPILLDIKETYAEEDNEFFSNPFTHQGERMIAASRIYSPGLEQRIGYCSHSGEQYWVRQIPSFNVKVAEELEYDEMLQLSRAVGIQIGRGHRIADKVYGPGDQAQAMIDVAESRLHDIVHSVEVMNDLTLKLFNELLADSA